MINITAIFYSFYSFYYNFRSINQLFLDSRKEKNKRMGISDDSSDEAYDIFHGDDDISTEMNK